MEEIIKENTQETEEEEKLRLAMEKSERIMAERRKKALEAAKLEFEKKRAEKSENEKSNTAERERRSAANTFKEVKQRFLAQYSSSQPSRNTLKNYVNSFHRRFKLGESVTLKDVEILCYCIIYESTFATEENLLYAVKKYLEFDKPIDAQKMINRFFDNNPQIKNMTTLKLDALRMISDYEKGKKGSFKK